MQNKDPHFVSRKAMAKLLSYKIRSEVLMLLLVMMKQVSEHNQMRGVTFVRRANGVSRHAAMLHIQYSFINLFNAFHRVLRCSPVLGGESRTSSLRDINIDPYL